MPYDVLTTVILGLHFVFVAYVVLGGFLAWRWPSAIWPHLLAAAWGLAIIAGRVECPLTWAEDWSRRRAGEARLTLGFVDRYIEGVLYPERYAGLVQAMCAGVVAVSWAGAYALWRHRQAARESLPIQS
ncbi:MAG TPA: DUF2784 domain-containing protein [Jiangellaceae bacterium]|nr:DUF2784 domain-containing protein [Jiangellaceae bacterium]